MRKFSASLLAISFFILLLLCSCVTDDTPDVVCCFTANAKVELNETVAHVELQVLNDTSITATFTSPKELKGLTYRYTNSTLYVDYKGLKCITNTDYMPHYSSADVLFDTLNSIKLGEYKLKSIDSEFDVYTGEAQYGEFTFYTDKNTGEILELVPSYTDCKISFYDIKAK